MEKYLLPLTLRAILLLRPSPLCWIWFEKRRAGKLRNQARHEVVFAPRGCRYALQRHCLSVLKNLV